MTIVDPSLEEVAILGAIVGIRALIGYVLEREIRHRDRLKPVIGKLIRERTSKQKEA